MGEASRTSSCRLRTCCCGCSLKTGCLIIGCLQMIGAFVYIGFGVAYLVIFNGLYDSEFRGPILDQILYINILYGCILATGIVQCVHAAVLIHATRKGKPGILFGWIIFYVIGLVGVAFGIAYNAMNAQYWFVIPNAVGLIFGIYFYVVVNSHRHELLNGAENIEMEGKAPPTDTRGHYDYYNNFHGKAPPTDTRGHYEYYNNFHGKAPPKY